MFATILLMVLLVVATVTDLKQQKIYNWTTYPGIVAGIAVNFAENRRAGLEDSLLGLAVCGGIMLVCFVLFNMGGGDLKLIAMMGACLGLYQGLEAMLWTFVLGGVLGAVLLIWQVGVGRLLSKGVRHLWLVVRTKSWIPLTDEERAPLRRRLYLAPAGLAAVCLVAVRSRWM